MKINDWNGIQTDFDDLSRQMDKSRVLVAKEGVPKFFIRLLVSYCALTFASTLQPAAIPDSYNCSSTPYLLMTDYISCCASLSCLLLETRWILRTG
jgi:Eukaryotic translation initiation factor 3 subunit 8 N-terminus